MIERPDRGEYRPIFVALIHGPSFLALSKWARALWYPVKLQLGPLGLAAMPGAVGVLSDLTGMTAGEVEGARAELVAGGWLRVEGHVWWLVRGLEFEPQLDPKNAKHQTFVRRAWGAVPNTLLRAEFAAQYPQWFPGMRPAQATGVDSLSNGHPIGYAIAPPITSPSPAPLPAPLPAPAPLPPPLALATTTTADRFGDHAPAIEAFIARVPVAERTAWRARIAGYLDGLGMPTGQRATPEAVALAVADLDGASINAAKVRRFVERALLDLAHPVGRQGATPSTGSAVEAAVRRLEVSRATR